jgi:FkbM family methyltransferase
MVLTGKAQKRVVSALLPESWRRKIKTALFDVPDTEASLCRMRQLGFNPRTVIDVGAYVGDWTRTCRRIFPEARVLMIEPQASRVPALESVATDLRNVELRSILLGATQQGRVPFYEAESASSVLSESDKQRPPTTCLSMTTLDAVTTGTPFIEPDFIKLDVQGYEVEVLRGGEQTLQSVEAVLMEVNLLGVYDKAPLFHETAEFMGKRGFHVYDICTFLRRPYDGALWQVDVIFVRHSSPLLSSMRWS